MLSGQQQQQSFNDICTVLILEETEKLYNKLITELTNWSITATATIRGSSLPLPPANNKQKLIHNNDEREEARYNNNRLEFYNNNQDQPNK